jgi:hypothetical protein
MTAGIRADYFNLIRNTVSFSPRVSLSYQANEILTFNFSAGLYHQAPSYIWLVANPKNKDLNFVSVQQYVAGVDYYLRGDVKMSIETYIKTYGDYPASTIRPYLVLANSGGFGGSQEGFSSFGLDPLASVGTGNSRGIELFLQKKFSEVPCYGLVSVTYNQSNFKALDGIERPFAFDQRWIINVGGGYILDQLWEFSGKFRFATGRPYTPYNPDGTQNTALYNSVRIASNHSLDLRVDRRWNYDTWTLITYIDIQNIYNRKAADVPQFNQRTKKVEQLTNSIGILPSIGISAEW